MKYEDKKVEDLLDDVQKMAKEVIIDNPYQDADLKATIDEAEKVWTKWFVTGRSKAVEKPKEIKKPFISRIAEGLEDAYVSVKNLKSNKQTIQALQDELHELRCLRAEDAWHTLKYGLMEGTKALENQVEIDHRIYHIFEKTLGKMFFECLSKPKDQKCLCCKERDRLMGFGK